MFVGPSRPRTAAARALLAGTTLHPVVRLGWKPLCEVHCNGCAAAPAFDCPAVPVLSIQRKQSPATLLPPHMCSGPLTTGNLAESSVSSDISVFCHTRLTGFFLGGHDRDLYIKCTSAEYRYLPMVDVSQGGCIMTCSHFEKAAGRELSKK